ncbi:hypothetical protein ACWEVD_18165 [Nocardia thailandica]
MTLLRGLSGLVAGGLIVLTAVVVTVAVVGARNEFPGPGAESLAWHLGITLVAVVAQVWADRRRGAATVPAALVVFAGAGLLLWTQWWN